MQLRTTGPEASLFFFIADTSQCRPRELRDSCLTHWDRSARVRRDRPVSLRFTQFGTGTKRCSAAVRLVVQHGIAHDVGGAHGPRWSEGSLLRYATGGDERVSFFRNDHIRRRVIGRLSGVDSQQTAMNGITLNGPALLRTDITTNSVV